MSKELEEKLDVIIKLLGANIIKEDSTQTDSIIKLKTFGIRNKDIAKIVNNTENYVKMVLSRNKNVKKRKK